MLTRSAWSRLRFGVLGICPKFVLIFSEKNKGGWKTQGSGKHTIKPPSQKRFWNPPPMIRFPPPVCFRPVVFLRGNRQTRQIPFSEASKTGFGGRTLWYVFPPENRTIRSAPPLAAFQLFFRPPTAEVHYDEHSIAEHPRFFERFIKPLPMHSPLKGHVRDFIDGTRVVVTGDPADMLFGTIKMADAFKGQTIEVTKRSCYIGMEKVRKLSALHSGSLSGPDCHRQSRKCLNLLLNSDCSFFCRKR